MDNNVRVYFEMDKEIEELFQMQSIDLNSIIKNSQPEVEVSYTCLHTADKQDRTKDIIPMIMASGVTISAIIIAISRLLDSIYYRPHYFEWDELVELKEKGKVIFDSNGNPIWKTRKKQKAIAVERGKNEYVIDFKVGIKGIVLKVKSSNK